MRVRGSSGVWELFIPGVGEGELYKYEIRHLTTKFTSKPTLCFYSELRPNTASIVYDIEGYEWHDADWMRERDSSNSFDKPISIYEVHLGHGKESPTMKTAFTHTGTCRYAGRVCEIHGLHPY